MIMYLYMTHHASAHIRVMMTRAKKPEQGEVLDIHSDALLCLFPHCGLQGWASESSQSWQIGFETPDRRRYAGKYVHVVPKRKKTY